MSEQPSLPSLDQSALSLLHQAKVPVNHDLSPLVQLMQWGLEDNRAQQYAHLLPAQGKALAEMEAWSPAEVERLLCEPEDPAHEAPLLRPDALEGLNPLQAASLLLRQFHDQLPLYLSSYPPLSDLRQASPERSNP